MNVASADPTAPEPTHGDQPARARGRGDHRPRSPRSDFLRSSLFLGVAMAVANVLSYVFVIILSRALGPADFGAFSAVNNAGLLFAIPAGALQIVVARHQRLADGVTGLALATTVGLSLSLVGVAVSPLGAWAFHLESPAPVALVMTILLPMTVTGAFQGILLGQERFGSLALVYLATALSRVAAALATAGWGLGVTGAFVAMVVASVVTAVYAAWLCRAHLRTHRAGSDSGLVREFLRSNRTLAALVALSSVDVLLARHYLPAEESGHYALAGLFARVVFWGTQFLALSLVPRMHADGARRRLLDAGALVLGLGLAVGVTVGLAPDVFVRISGGAAYVQADVLLVGFVVLGTCWALAQVWLFGDMGSDRSGLGLLALAAAAIQFVVVAIWWHDNVFQILGAAVGSALLVVLAGLVRVIRTPRDAPAPAILTIAPAEVDSHPE